MLRACLVLWCLASVAPPHAQAQEAPPHAHGQMPASGSAPGGWAWAVDARAFFGVNHQERKFRDFTAWESQNWLMAAAEHRAAGGSLWLNGMFSMEPFTMRKIGSPQVFQTGETYRLAPLIDYQHPHDLFMALGAEYRGRRGRLDVVLAADAVGSPALGPLTFMHRPSAAGNPEAPLSHHYLDSTHITPGVLRAGLGTAGLMMEGSDFRGREPDERRTDIDFGPLDSYAMRLSWARAGWSAQASVAALTLPELTTPYDAKKLTASVGRTGGGRVAAWMFAFGQNREIHGNLEAYLFEAALRAGSSGRLYTRAESVAKDILDAGFHPRGVFHRHRQSQVAALTAGYLHTVAQSAAGAIGIGGHITGYVVPDNLTEPYGQPISFHLFLSYALRPVARGTAGGSAGGHAH